MQRCQCNFNATMLQRYDDIVRLFRLNQSQLQQRCIKIFVFYNCYRYAVLHKGSYRAAATFCAYRVRKLFDIYFYDPAFTILLKHASCIVVDKFKRAVISLRLEISTRYKNQVLL